MPVKTPGAIPGFSQSGLVNEGKDCGADQTF